MLYGLLGSWVRTATASGVSLAPRFGALEAPGLNNLQFLGDPGVVPKNPDYGYPAGS